MARWKITAYLTDECQEHGTLEECNTPPVDWDEEIDGEYEPEYSGYCWHPVEKGGLEDRDDAESWMEVLLTYGNKHQSASFIDVTIEPVN